jgi:hypothetical protein
MGEEEPSKPWEDLDMPLRRWFGLVALLGLSLTVTVLPVLYVLVVHPAMYPRMVGSIRSPRSVPFIQLLEPIVDYGLLRLRGWGWFVGVPWFASKGVYAAGLAIGMAIGGRSTALLVGLPFALLWLGIVLFLHTNRIYFDE